MVYISSHFRPYKLQSYNQTWTIANISFPIFQFLEYLMMVIPETKFDIYVR